MNQNKIISCDKDKMIIVYTDTNKHFVYKYEPIVPKNKVQIKKMDNKNYKFTPEQQKLFRQALYGLYLYNEKSLKKMSFLEKNRISNMHSRASKILNFWKQELADNIVDSLLLTFLPNAKITKLLTSYSGQKSNNVKTISFEKLGVTQYQIALKLVNTKVLPHNFFNL